MIFFSVSLLVGLQIACLVVSFLFTIMLGVLLRDLFDFWISYDIPPLKAARHTAKRYDKISRIRGDK